MTTPFRFGYRFLSKAFQAPGRVAPRRRRLRPTVTALESRALLSMLTVSNINDTGTGSLRAAVAQADADGGGDMIVFSSLFNTPQTITLTSGQLELTGTAAATTIDGPGANLLSVSGNNFSRVFQIDPGVTASISGLTITGGNGGNYGNGGGGLYNRGGTVTLTNCAVSGNSSYHGGGLSNYGNPYVDVPFATMSLTNCTISGNHAFGSFAGLGGGLYTKAYSNATLTNCTVSGNSAQVGGGLSTDSSGTATLTNCTVSGNSAAQDGGLLLLTRGTLNNTIVAGNSSSGGSFSGRDIFGTFSGSNNLIGGNPLLAPLGDYGGPTQTMALLPGSPAIDAGTSTGAPTTDQRGLGRVGGVDIGAFESQGFMLDYVSGSNQSATVDTAFTNPLVVNVNANNSVEPVAGGVVTYTGPSTGASVAPNPSTAAITAGGQASLPATANTVGGSYTVTTSAAGARSASFSLTNTPGAATQLVVSGFPNPVIAGSPGAVTITALDQFGNVDNSGPNAFNGTVTITSSDGLATLPSSAALSNGSGNFNVTLKTAGTQSITATVGSITGSQTGITVNPAAANAYRISAASTTPTAGANDQLTLELVDQFGNIESSGPNDFSGGKTLTFSGLATSPGGYVPTITDKNGTAVNLGTSEVLTFTHGVSSAGGILVATDVQTAALAVTDGALSSSGPGGTGVSLTVSPAAEAVAVVSGSGQSATVAQTFANPLVVVVTDIYGNLFPNVSVTFAVRPARLQGLRHCVRVARRPPPPPTVRRASRPRPTRSPVATA